jgi:hypothetical protein
MDKLSPSVPCQWLAGIAETNGTWHAEEAGQDGGTVHSLRYVVNCQMARQIHKIAKLGKMRKDGSWAIENSKQLRIFITELWPHIKIKKKLWSALRGWPFKGPGQKCTEAEKKLRLKIQGVIHDDRQ